MDEHSEGENDFSCIFLYVCVRTTYYAYRRDSEHELIRRAYDTASGYVTFDDDVSLDFVHAHRVD